MDRRGSRGRMAILGLPALAAAIATHHLAAAQTRAGTGENAAIYAAHCAGCHGEDLRGRMGASLIDDDWRFGGSEKEIIASITHGRGEMPPFGKVLSERQIRSLVFYIAERKLLAQKAGAVAPPDPTAIRFSSKYHGFRLHKVAETKTGQFWSVNFLPDGRIVAPEKTGRLWIIAGDGSKQLVKGTPTVVESIDGGLLEVTPHPDYARNGWLYMAYVAGRKAGEKDSAFGKIADIRGNTRIVRGRIRNGAWVDQQTIFQFRPEHSELLGMRFGSRIIFRDGFVYFSVGDGGRNDLAQDLTSPISKVFRLHDDGRVPADNPFVTVAGAYRGIWTYGNRNVQGFAFQPGTGRLIATEHGPRGGDEVNILRKGANYGWPAITYGINYDGTIISDRTAAPGMEQPIHYWVPSIAPGGIDFSTGNVFPRWRGDLFVTGLGSQELHRLRIAGDKVVEDEIVLRNIGRLRDIVTGPDGTLYLVTNSRSPDTGTIYRFVPADRGGR